MQVRNDKIFSEKAVAQKTELLTKCLEAAIDAYIKLHPDMRKGEAKQSRNLTNLINIHAQIRDTLKKPMRDICAIEKYTLIIKLIEAEIKRAINNFADDNKKKSLPDDLLHKDFADFLNEKQKQRDHHRSRLLCLLASAIYTSIDSGYLPEPSLARRKGSRILRVEEVKRPAKNVTYIEFTEKLRWIVHSNAPSKGASNPEDHHAEQVEDLLNDIDQQLQKTMKVYTLAHANKKKTKHGEELRELVQVVARQTSREVNTTVVDAKSERHQIALIKLENILNILQTALLTVSKAKLKPQQRSFASKKHADIESLIQYLNKNSSKSHYTRMLCLILNNTYARIDSNPDIGISSPLKRALHPSGNEKDRVDIALLDRLVHGVKPQPLQTVLAYEYSKIFNEYKLDTLPVVAIKPVAFNKSE